MRATWRGLAALAFLVATTSVGWAEEIPPGLGGGQRGPGVAEFYVRTGYRVDLVAEKVGETRFIEFDDHGNLFVAQPTVGTIAILHRQDDGTYKFFDNLVTGKKTAHGMCFYKGTLWFTQSGAIHKAKLKPDGTADGPIVTVIPEGQLPEGGHWWRSILIDDDGFYTSIGDSGNANDETNTDRQKIWRYDLEGKNRKLFASGIRNTEKLRFRPGTSEVWGCDHGSDNFGQVYGERVGDQPITDLWPPDKINHYVEGGFYGHPYFAGTRIPRPEFAKRPDLVALADKMTPPAWQLGAHWAPNASTFLSRDYFPGHKGDLFVALHGSWNSTKKVGYGIERVMFDAESGNPYGAWRIVTTLTGPADNPRVEARPVDCAEAPDGSVLFSDDSHGKIYRISKAQP
jgi:glucose/arabinose dehydrogenase